MRAISLSCLAACASAGSPLGGADADPGGSGDDHHHPHQDAGIDAPQLVDAAPTMPDAASPASRQLPIPPRQQWENGDGYCGEMSIQSIALYDGAWISEQVVRSVAGGELLLGVNETVALSRLHLDYSAWDSGAPQPQATGFLAWMKTQLQQGVPVIYAVYLTDGNNDPDYDHIVPAVGIDATTLGGYVATDELASNNNFGARIVAAMGSLPATRQTCANDTAHGGCVPRNVDYGVAVSGVTDLQHATLPVTMTVVGMSEPNVSLGASATQMTATVTVSGLTAGQSYTVLRYDDYRKVPTNSTAAQFLTSQFTHRTDFVATGTSWTFDDPTTFLSSGTTYYRAVPL
jgi:hypothetical protein